MLAKMRLVVVEKWEGHCWQDCLGNGTGSSPCHASCGVENDMLDTLGRVKAMNPGTATVLYWNTLLAFPFYTAVGKFADRNLLMIDSSTNKPISITNDNGMGDIGVYAFDKPDGVELWVETIKNFTSTGVVDGFFGDKWGSCARKASDGQWQICNHGCGNVTAAQAAAWNAGKRVALAAATEHVGAGPFFASPVSAYDGVDSNLNGRVIVTPRHYSYLDPRDLITDVKSHLANYTYYYWGCAGDQVWKTDPNNSSSLRSTCSDQSLARFLLAVEKGAFIATNGWDPAYEQPLGDPLGPAVYTAAETATDGTLVAPARIHRNFASGTFVTFTYDASGTSGSGEIWWGGKPPAPMPPTPRPPPPAPTPPGPAPPPIACGNTHSTLLPDTTMMPANTTSHIKVTTKASAPACCTACAANPQCVEWAWKSHAQGRYAASACHLHGAGATAKHEKGTISGVMSRS